MRLLSCLLALPVMTLCAPVWAVPSLFEPVTDGVYVVRDDGGHWAGHMSRDITHQNSAPYQARKILDLTNVPEDVWARTQSVRVALFFMVCDYSWHDDPPRKGLDEAYQIVVNGTVHEYPTAGGPPVFIESAPPTMAWYDHILPKSDFVHGENEIIIRKAPSKTNDDYLYLGIDMGERRGNSYVTFDGGPWRQDMLTIPGGNGEYMVRMYLICNDTHLKAVWRPAQQPETDDPGHLLLYAGFPAPSPCAAGWPATALQKTRPARLEWEAVALDRRQPLTVTVDASGPVKLSWLDEKSNVAPDGVVGSSITLPANSALRPSGLIVDAPEGGALPTLHSVTVEAWQSVHPRPRRIDMCPTIAAPAGKPADRKPSCVIRDGAIRLQNADLRCRFATADTLKLVSLYNEYTGTEMVTDPDAIGIFVVDVGDKRCIGSRDFRCLSATPQGAGFVAELRLEQPALRATLSVGIEDEGLRMDLELRNADETPVHFTTAFPHLAGLVASGDPAEDYYFYPLGGGIYADTPALIRSTYGEYRALYQVMDLYSPRLGGGLSLRIDDTEGWLKGLSLRKHVRGVGGLTIDKLVPRTRDEYKCANSLDEVEGTGFACEYLRRTRGPGESFRPGPAVISAHPGDWHVTMERYSAWAHDVWSFRPYPSRLKEIRNMMPYGWAGDFLFRDGKYRTDLVEPPRPGLGRTRTDCVELMSWWEWSPLGPFATPFDRLSEVMSEDQIKRWQNYFVKDPVTGQTMWNNGPNAYDGYNDRFGGLPAFREFVRTCQEQGALVTLYTDPFRLDHGCALGREKGELWGVIGPDGEYTTSYEVWNPCHDTPEVREWVATTTGRIMRETGADGIRLDEYGHAGHTCFSDLHEHTYQEPGVSQWNKAVAETCRMVHAEMDRVRPDLVLTTEFPGYDYMMQYLEGAITYDLSITACALRPLECNIQRFYFPECKPYELDYHHTHQGLIKKFWNGAESFEQYHPLNMHIILGENGDVYQGRDFWPLIPSLSPHVYINQFGGSRPAGLGGLPAATASATGAKTIYHVYNATGHTFEGPALKLSLRPDEHLFDLLNCREHDAWGADGRTDERGDVEVGVALLRDHVACLARLPRLLSLAPDGSVTISAGKLPKGKLTLVICGLQGEALASQEFKTGANRLDLSGLAADAHPACVKLMADGTLLDVAELPVARGG